VRGLLDVCEDARACLWAGHSAETVLLGILDRLEEKFKGEVPYTERSAMKVFVNAVIPESPGAVDVHISLRDLRPGQEMSVAQAFSSIESALADGKITFFEGLSIVMALAAIGK
jgi:hypothetical protein